MQDPVTIDDADDAPQSSETVPNESARPAGTARLVSTPAEARPDAERLSEQANGAQAQHAGAVVAEIDDADPSGPGATRAEDPGLSHPLAQDLLLNPTGWRIWPAVAVLRWLRRGRGRSGRELMYRSHPGLQFNASELMDVSLKTSGVELILNAPGLAAPGSALPVTDVARVMADQRRGGGIAAWLDGPGDRFMQAVEAAEARNNAAFALATGGRLEALHVVANLVGRSSTLAADGDSILSDTVEVAPAGAVGLARLFLGPISASGLAALFEAFAELPTRVEEFAGAEVTVLRSARLGGVLGRILGTTSRPAAAGVDIVLQGGSDPEARKWASDPAHRRALALLASSYIGSPSPEARMFLELAPGNAPPATLGEGTAFGGLAVLGKAEDTVRLPLAG